MAHQTVVSSSKLTCFFMFVSSLCFATANTLNRGSSLSVKNAHSDLLTSPDKSFTCGFYGVPGRNAYWFSIWFTNSKDKTVVWMANRDRPVGLESKVSLRRDGSMVLTNHVDFTTIIWETSTGSTGVDRAELLNSGNLVLKDPNGTILWQSFDFPTDTLLPNQPFKKSSTLVSNLGRGNFGAGYFNFYFDNDNVLKLMYDGPDISSMYWPDLAYSVNQNGRNAVNSSRIAVLDELGSFSSSDELQFSAIDMGSRVKKRLTMDYDGNLRLYSLNSSTGLWVITWQAMAEPCKIHGICGRNGICIYTPAPKCSCPPGYEVADASNLNLGCKPKFKRTCSKSQEEKFVQIPQVNFYGFDLNLSLAVSIDDCRQLCLGDCRCEAFSYWLNGEGRCYTKSALFNGYKSPDFWDTIYLRMPVSFSVNTSKPQYSNASIPCKTNGPAMYGTTGKRVRWVYLYSFAFAVGAVEFLFIVSGWWLLFRRHGSAVTPVEVGYRVISSQFRRFRFNELKNATKNFQEELGRGASGSVYKGVLEDERVVAVKKLADIHKGEDVFWAEVSTIGKINHMNLVRIWGFCSEDKHRLLVSEFVENGSLDKHLFTSNLLGWKERYKVALGIAKGLAYLHHECLEWVIHCDVKPENILLDSDFEPKIADFGLAKLTQRDRLISMFSHIRGTKGYMAPEWAMNLRITAKVDVYSYGVVILEIVKGIRLTSWVLEDIEEEQEAELTKFVREAKRKIQQGEELLIEDVADPRLEGQFSRNQAAKMVEIGIACVEEDRSKRPTMDSVVKSLLECEDESYIHSSHYKSLSFTLHVLSWFVLAILCEE